MYLLRNSMLLMQCSYKLGKDFVKYGKFENVFLAEQICRNTFGDTDICLERYWYMFWSGSKFFGLMFFFFSYQTLRPRERSHCLNREKVQYMSSHSDQNNKKHTYIHEEYCTKGFFLSPPPHYLLTRKRGSKNKTRESKER